jgi:hypothetical protein
MKSFLRQAFETQLAEARLATQAATGKCGRTSWLTSTILLVTLIVLLAVASTANAASRYAVQNGNWNSTTVWSATSGGSSGASIPVTGDDVFIEEASNGRTVTIPTGYRAACTSLTMGNEAAAVAGALNFNNSTSSLAVSGNVVMNRPGGAATTTINLAAGSMTVGGNLELAHHTATSAAVNRINRVSVSTGTLTVSGDLIFGAEAAAQSQIVFSSTGRVNLAGAFTLSNSLGTLTPSTGTVNFNGTAAQTIPIGVSSVGYNNVLLNNTSASGAIISAAITGSGTNQVIGNLSVQSGTFDNGGLAISLASGKSFSVSNGATFKLTGTTSSMVSVSGGGTITFGASSTVNYAGTTQTVTTATYGNLTIRSGTKTFTSPMTIAGTLALDSSSVVSPDSGSSYTAHALPIGGVLKVAESWGNTGAGAASINPTHFADTGVLNVNTGAVDAAQSVSSPAIASITANGSSTQVITEQARDINKNFTIGGSTMLISKSSGTGSLDGTENNGKGTYTATVTSPKMAGSGTFTATTEWGLSMMTILFVGVALWDSIRSRKNRRQSPFQSKQDMN